MESPLPPHCALTSCVPTTRTGQQWCFCRPVSQVLVRPGQRPSDSTPSPPVCPASLLPRDSGERSWGQGQQQRRREGWRAGRWTWAGWRVGGVLAD